MQKRSAKRPVNGVLLLNKEPGYSSNQALQKARWLFNAAKAGHTGSLDPLATGVLPICFGEATKFARFLLDSDKRYRATMTFGCRSDTGDSEGRLLEEAGAKNLTRHQVETLLPRFRGPLEQVPPMYSALKHQGRPLYELAREGIEIERAPRSVTIHQLEVVDCRPRETARGIPVLDVEVEVACSKGTYIRSLAMDMGEAVGCGALISALHRRQSGTFEESRAVTLQQLEQERGANDPSILDHHLLPVDVLVADLQKVSLQESSAYYFRQGQPVLVPRVLKQTVTGEEVAVFGPQTDFLGVAEILPDGRVAPRRLMVFGNDTP